MRTFDASLFFTPASAELRYLPECPLRLRNSGESKHLLGWVAIQNSASVHHGSLNILDLDTRVNRSIPLHGRPGFFAETTKPGTVVVGMEHRLVLVDIHSGAVTETHLHIPDTRNDVIINDGLAVPGGIVFGTKHLEFTRPVANLYFFESATRTIRVIVDQQLCSNGKFYFENANGTVTLIDTDSMPKAITEYRFTPGFTRLIERMPIVNPDSLRAFPDGLRPSPDGKSILVALFDGSLAPDGSAALFNIESGLIEATWHIPGSPRVTCPELVVMDGKIKVLFVTATEGATPQNLALAPHSGSFFLADTPFQMETAAPVLPGPPLVDFHSLIG